MPFRRARPLAACLLALALIAGCTSSTNGIGGSSPTVPTTPASTTGTTSSALPSASGSTSSSSTASTPGHPVPARPIKSATVHASDAVTYVVKIWADVSNKTCFDHAYGQPMITFLTEHPCRGLERYLGTTSVGGRAVGFAESVTSFAGTAKDPYANSSAFRQLVERDGTGSIDDLLRDGYRLPAGPTAVPSPDAFSCVGQDNGVTVWDAWYLDGPTPANDKALVQMTMDLYLQF